MFHRTGQAAYKPGIGNISELCTMLGNPEKHLRFVHIAGTNGKGSTAHLMASALQEAGYVTGLHTSPHLVDFRERIRVNGEMIPKEDLVAFVETYRKLWEPIEPSFFEIGVAMAFWYFRRIKTEICVIETGLGGRLDSTNIITPELSVITPIGMDHMNLLGNTIEAIAAEKAGIIKPGIPVVISAQRPVAAEVLRARAVACNSPLTDASAEKEVPPVPLAGRYQQVNAATAACALRELRNRGWQVKEEHIRRGFEQVFRNTGLRGRWEVIRQSPTVICDVGHNEDGIRQVVRQLSETPHRRLHIVLGMVSDKDIGRILTLLPPAAHYYFCKADIPRGMDASALRETAKNAGLQGEVHPSVEAAYRAALAHSGEEDLVVVTGSFFTVAEVLASLTA
jgi:dihydrofolate synthase / folylpolyglutamate synthase